MKLQPLSNNVLVEHAVEEKVTSSGIVLPDNADAKKQARGTVVAIGPGKLTDQGTRLPMAVKVGDQVLFKEPWSDAGKLEENGKKFSLVEENDILGIL
jgi:chaperonin GroES